MSLDVMDSEQVIHDGPIATRTYYGFHVTTSADSGDVFPFKDAEQRASWIALFSPLFAGSDSPPWDARDAAGLVALAEFGDDGEREKWGYVLDERWPALCDRDAFDDPVEAWKEANL